MFVHGENKRQKLYRTGNQTLNHENHVLEDTETLYHIQNKAIISYIGYMSH